MSSAATETARQRVLVTGGAGFIGSHLVEALISRGHEVLVLDDLSTGRQENLDSLNGHHGLRLEIGSVNDRALVCRLVSQADLVFHLAAVVGANHVVEDPLATMRTNLFGTAEVLDAAARLGRRVVFVSTSELYSHEHGVPFHEDQPTWLGAPGVGRWSYAAAKAAAEQLALAHAETSGLEVVIPRLFNTVGERQRARYGMVVPRFIDQVLEGEPITVYGDGNQTRCFVDVRDAVRALIGLAQCPEAAGQVVNIGSTDEVTILELAGLVQQVAGDNARPANGFSFIPYSEVFGSGFEDAPRRLPAIERIGRLIGWRPTVSLEETLTRVFNERKALHGLACEALQ